MIKEIIWNVIGVDQHGEKLDFDVDTLEEAEKHAKRFDRLGGKVKIRKMKFNGPAATWLDENGNYR